MADGSFANISVALIGTSGWSCFFFAATVVAYLTDLLCINWSLCPSFYKWRVTRTKVRLGQNGKTGRLEQLNAYNKLLYGSRPLTYLFHFVSLSCGNLFLERLRKVLGSVWIIAKVKKKLVIYITKAGFECDQLCMANLRVKSDLLMHHIQCIFGRWRHCTCKDKEIGPFDQYITLPFLLMSGNTKTAFVSHLQTDIQAAGIGYKASAGTNARRTTHNTHHFVIVWSKARKKRRPITACNFATSLKVRSRQTPQRFNVGPPFSFWSEEALPGSAENATFKWRLRWYTHFQLVVLLNVFVLCVAALCSEFHESELGDMLCSSQKGFWCWCLISGFLDLTLLHVDVSFLVFFE